MRRGMTSFELLLVMLLIFLLVGVIVVSFTVANRV